jgi:hypothetical protein
MLMVPYKSSSDPRAVIKFLCSSCNWVYYIKNPKVGKVDRIKRSTKLRILSPNSPDCEPHQNERQRNEKHPNGVAQIKAELIP